MSRTQQARVVGLGEATHGTHETEEWRRREILALIGQGFDTLALEAMPDVVAPLDEYVRTGAGDLDAIVRGLAPWDTVEMRELIKRIGAAGTSVHFVGVDQRKEWGPGILSEQIGRRDAAMAQALLAALPGHRIVLLAHDAHVERGHVGAIDALSMGHHLAEALGGDYVAVGTVLGTGELLARDRSTFELGTFPLEPPEPNSLEMALATERQGELLDARRWRTPVTYRTVGTVYVPGSRHPLIVPSAEFDALVYFATSTPTTPL